jgi:hypothetical protein
MSTEQNTNKANGGGSALNDGLDGPRRPWMTQPNHLYDEKGAWEALSDFESWIIEKIGGNFSEIYNETDPNFQTELYIIFCKIFDAA